MRFISGAAKVKQIRRRLPASSVALVAAPASATPSAPSSSGLGGITTVPADALGEGMADGAVEGDAALQENFLARRRVALDSVEVIGGDGVDEAGDDVLARLPLLQGDADVGVDEGGAGRLELDRRRRPQRDVGDLRDVRCRDRRGRFPRETSPVPAEQALFIA